MESPSTILPRGKKLIPKTRKAADFIKRKSAITPELQALIEEARKDYEEGRCVSFASMEDFDNHYECV